MLCGIPIIDLKAGDEAFAQVLLALMEQQESQIKGDNDPIGKEIFISMAQCAASWLITALPQLQFVENEEDLFSRSGNEHRSFIPCNCYQTLDGYVYLAIGNDIQWRKLTEIDGFTHLAKKDRATNQGRDDDKERIYEDIRTGLKQYSTAGFIEVALRNNLAVAPVHSTKEVAEQDFVKKNMLKTQLPSGREVELFPAAADTEFLKENKNLMKCAPRHGENNSEVYTEAGLSADEIKELHSGGVI